MLFIQHKVDCNILRVFCLFCLFYFHSVCARITSTPTLASLGKVTGKNNEPLRGYCLMFIIAWLSSSSSVSPGSPPDQLIRGVSLCERFNVWYHVDVSGDLNTIAPLISNFFLSLLRPHQLHCCFHATITKSPGENLIIIIVILVHHLCLIIMFIISHRLAAAVYRYFSPWTSLFAAFLSSCSCFLFTWWAALITFAIVLCLLGYVTYKKPCE